MIKTARSRAEELFTATQKKDAQALKDKEKAGQAIADQVSKLRALRLAKEAADKEAAEAAETEKAPAKTEKAPAKTKK